MIKVEVIEDFSLGRFNEIKNLVRKAKNKNKELYIGDTFECEEDLAKYLLNEDGYKNPENRPFVRVIEVAPEVKEIEVKEEQIKKTAKKKTTKNAIAKK